MRVTGLPPSLEGIVIAPVVDCGTAVDELEPPPTLAYPLATVYVHVIPSTVSVKARHGNEADITNAARAFFIVFMRLFPLFDVSL